VAIFIDLNQVVIANLMVQRDELSEDLIRHMVLNTLRHYRRHFATYGELIICSDSSRYWRKDLFPYYKAHRKKARDASAVDWTLIFKTLDMMRTELRTYFPYKFLCVEGAESDDVIATLAPRLAPHEKVMIVSSDRDYIQLQKYKNIEQYSPTTKTFIRSDNPQAYTREHILTGDRSDGIPNFLSSDSVFVRGERQKSLSKKKLAEWINMPPQQFCTTEALEKGYKRNQLLIDFDHIPEHVKESIINEYDSYVIPKRTGLLNYFIDKRLRNLTEVIHEF